MKSSSVYLRYIGLPKLLDFSGHWRLPLCRKISLRQNVSGFWNCNRVSLHDPLLHTPARVLHRVHHAIFYFQLNEPSSVSTTVRGLFSLTTENRVQYQQSRVCFELTCVVYLKPRSLFSPLVLFLLAVKLPIEQTSRLRERLLRLSSSYMQRVSYWNLIKKFSSPKMRNLCLILRGRGFEPPSLCRHQHLKLACLPGFTTRAYYQLLIFRAFSIFILFIDKQTTSLL